MSFLAYGKVVLLSLQLIAQNLVGSLELVEETERYVQEASVWMEFQKNVAMPSF